MSTASAFWDWSAWFAWHFIHLMYLVEFDNMLLVFVQWALNYLAHRCDTGSSQTNGGNLSPHRLLRVGFWIVAGPCP